MHAACSDSLFADKTSARCGSHARSQELLGCDSAGIACAVAAAFPHAYLSEPSGGGDLGVPVGGAPVGRAAPARPLLPDFPPDVLEFDVRGRMDVGADSAYAYVDVGEAKSRAEYSSGVAQLGVRLGVLRWLLTAACGVPDGHVRTVGRLFMPATSVDALQEEVARQEWRFSLYVHQA